MEIDIKGLKSKLLEDIDMDVRKVYEVYVEDHDGNERLYIFKSKESFQSSLGDFINNNYQITHEGYSNVNLTNYDYQDILKKGYILY
jgi:hypothetical protein